MTVPRATTIVEQLLQRAEESPDNRYVQTGGPWLSYSDVVNRSHRVTGGLQHAGVLPGDRIGLVLPNCLEFVDLIFACAWAGAIQVPLNTALKGEFLRHQLADSQASRIVTDVEGAEQIRPIVKQLPELREIIVVGGLNRLDPREFRVSLTDYAEVAESGAVPTLRTVRPGDISSVVYTSGTTGMPKGCVMSFRYSAAIAQVQCDSGWFEKGATLYTPWRLFHTSGQQIALGVATMAGGSVVLEPEFSASRFVSRLRETGATHTYGPGAVGMALLSQPPREDDRAHECRLGEFVPMPVSKCDEFTERFGIEVLNEIGGHSECTPFTMSRVDGPRQPGSAGAPLPFMDVRLFDDDDVEVGVGEVGEICVRPNATGLMFEGYWNNPESTLEMRRHLWHHTGDCGRFDENGFLWFVDRKKDAIRRRGEFVSSAELELAILVHPKVAAVAVVAVPSDLTEDDIKAYIVLKPRETVSPAELFEFLKTNFPYFAVPRYVELIETLPVNAVGRVMKHTLRERSTTDKTWDFQSMGFAITREERRGATDSLAARA